MTLLKPQKLDSEIKTLKCIRIFKLKQDRDGEKGKDLVWEVKLNALANVYVMG